MTKPILNSARVVARIRQRVAAAVAKHVGMNLERKAGALAYSFDKPVNSVRRERAATLRSEYKAAVRELPA